MCRVIKTVKSIKTLWNIIVVVAIEFGRPHIGVIMTLLSLKRYGGCNLSLKFVGLRGAVGYYVCVCSALMVLRLFPRLFTDDSAVSWMNHFVCVGFTSITWYYDNICTAVAQTKYTICNMFHFFSDGLHITWSIRMPVVSSTFSTGLLAG